MDEPPIAPPPPTPTTEAPAQWADALRLSPDEVVRRRLLAALILRIIGLVCAVAWVAPVSSWLFEGLHDGDLLNLYYYANRLISAAVLMLVAATGFLFAPRIARRLVPVAARPLCPACGFDLEGLAAPRCPECGLAFVVGHAPRQTPLQFQTWVLAAVLVIRSMAVGLIAFGVSSRLASLWWYDVDQTLYTLLYPLMGWAEFLRFAIMLASTFGPGLLLWCLAPRIARAAVRFAR